MKDKIKSNKIILPKTITVKLVKLKEADNPLHPNNIEEGREEVITIFEHHFNPPKIGERFTLVGLGRWFSTSLVQKIINDNTFETYNSIYKWEIIK